MDSIQQVAYFIGEVNGENHIKPTFHIFHLFKQTIDFGGNRSLGQRKNQMNGTNIICMRGKTFVRCPRLTRMWNAEPRQERATIRKRLTRDSSITFVDWSLRSPKPIELNAALTRPLRTTSAIITSTVLPQANENGFKWLNQDAGGSSRIANVLQFGDHR